MKGVVTGKADETQKKKEAQSQNAGGMPYFYGPFYH